MDTSGDGNSNHQQASDSSKRRKNANGYSAEGSNDTELKRKEKFTGEPQDEDLGDYFNYIQKANEGIRENCRLREDLKFSSNLIENGDFLSPSITNTIFPVPKAKPKVVSMPQVFFDHSQMFQDYRICSASNLVITLAASPRILLSLDGEGGVNTIRQRLRNLGYDRFVVRLNRHGQIEVVDRVCFEEGLARWAKSQKSGRVGEAVQAIKEAFNTNANVLALHELELTSLPEELSQLSSLEALHLGGNKLTSLPAWIGDLSELRLLYLDCNKLTTLPAEMSKLSKLVHLSLWRNQLTSLLNEMSRLSSLKHFNIGSNPLGRLPSWIGDLQALTELTARDLGLVSLPAELFNLTQLTLLNLSQNRLQMLPPEIRNLSNLRGLHLYDNRELLSLPVEIDNLTHLETLDVAFNQNLSSLPLTLGNCTQLNRLEIGHTRISVDIAREIMSASRRHRDGDVLTVLPQRLALWQAASGKRFQLDFIHGLKLKEKQDIAEWLFRLGKTKDFSSAYQQELAEAACGMLQSLNEIPSFKEDFFVQVPLNNVDCADRAGMAFNEIYLAWRLATLPDDASEKDKLKLMAQAAKTVVFRSALADRIAAQEQGMGESVEIYLYYEVKLKDEFDLLTAMKSMRYEVLGRRNWIENSLGTIKERVNGDFVSEMVGFAPLKKLLQNDADFVAAWSKPKKKFDDRLAEIENNMADENGYLTQMNQLQKDRDGCYNALAKTAIERKLRHHGLLVLLE